MKKRGKYTKNVKDYNKYLNSEYWVSLKKKFYKRRSRHCVICGKIKELHVHHKQYFKKGVSILYHERLNQLVCLCAKCHKKFDKERKLLKEQAVTINS